MSVAVSTIAADAAELLLDTGYDRWDQDFHLESANEAERQAVILKPDVYVVTSSFQLVQGPKQSLPTTAIQLERITRNRGVAGSTDGAEITLINRDDLAAVRPDWHADTYESTTVEHYMHDEKDPLTFWIYPAQTSSPYYVEAIYAAYPTPITAIGNNINLADIYRDLIKHYMVFRAHALDAANSQFSAQRAVQAWNLFVTMLERKDLVERAYSPKLRNAANGNSNQ